MYFLQIEPVDNILNGREYCVKTSRSGLLSVKEIQVLIKKRGGRSVCNPNIKKTHAIIAGDLNFEVKTLMKSDYNIVKVEWILSALNESTINKKLPKLSPFDMISTSKQLKEVFAENFDEYGDSYTKEVTEKDLKNILDRMDVKNLPEIDENAKMEVLESIGSDSFNIFHKKKAVFLGIEKSFQLKASKMLFELRGGKVLGWKDASEHFVFVDPLYKETAGNSKLISWKWILACQDAKTILATEKFEVN